MSVFVSVVDVATGETESAFSSVPVDLVAMIQMLTISAATPSHLRYLWGILRFLRGAVPRPRCVNVGVLVGVEIRVSHSTGVLEADEDG